MHRRPDPYTATFIGVLLALVGLPGRGADAWSPGLYVLAHRWWVGAPVTLDAAWVPLAAAVFVAGAWVWEWVSPRTVDELRGP